MCVGFGLYSLYIATKFTITSFNRVNYFLDLALITINHTSQPIPQTAMLEMQYIAIISQPSVSQPDEDRLITMQTIVARDEKNIGVSLVHSFSALKHRSSCTGIIMTTAKMINSIVRSIPPIVMTPNIVILLVKRNIFI